jgi:hypothetical protein
MCYMVGSLDRTFLPLHLCNWNLYIIMKGKGKVEEPR